MTTEEKLKAKTEMKKNLKEFLMNIRMIKAAVEMDEPDLGDILVEAMQEELVKLHSKPDFPAGVRKAMQSQPMGGKSEEEIKTTRERAMAALTEKGFYVVNTLFTDEWYDAESVKSGNVVQRSLFFLAKSLEEMSKCHAVYFCKGWENARGCRIEHEAAKAYGLEIIYEE